MGKQVKERKGGGNKWERWRRRRSIFGGGGGGFGFFSRGVTNGRPDTALVRWRGSQSPLGEKEKGGGSGLGEIFESPFFFEKGHSDRGGRERREETGEVVYFAFFAEKKKL